MPKKINIFLTVIDNLGDMGFACELVRSFAEIFPDEYYFDIWTDSVGKVSDFFEKNPEIYGAYSIRDMSILHEKTGTISFLLFHYPIPLHYPESDNELFLRIDYLSFDADWVKNHGKEHIASTKKRQIIEIIPSPLTGSGGIITPTLDLLDRDTLSEIHGLDSGKKWVSIFAYRETLESQFEFDMSGDDVEILLFGMSSRISSVIKNTKILPFVSQKTFTSLIRESEWAIIRGEVSFISTLQLGTPFFWNMYQEIGGFHSEQAAQFLDWKVANQEYRDLFYRLNGQTEGIVKYSEINSYFRENPGKKMEKFPELVKEIQKYVDMFGISL